MSGLMQRLRAEISAGWPPDIEELLSDAADAIEHLTKCLAAANEQYQDRVDEVCRELDISQALRETIERQAKEIERLHSLYKASNTWLYVLANDLQQLMDGELAGQWLPTHVESAMSLVDRTLIEVPRA